MKVSVCVDSLYFGKDFLESVRAAQRAGAKAVEFWSWEDKDLDGLVRLQEETGLQVAVFCTRATQITDPKMCIRDSNCIAAEVNGLRIPRCCLLYTSCCSGRCLS